jgi:hypothetical protein
VGGHGCGHGAQSFLAGAQSGFAQEDFAAGFDPLLFIEEPESWPNTAVATRSDATIQGFVFVSKFSIFCSPFWTNS